MPTFKRVQLNQVDIDFILAQLTLPGNDPRNAVPPSILGSFGIRDVQGIGNNVLNPTWGAVDQLFPRLTVDSTPPSAQGRPVTPNGVSISSTPPPGSSVTSCRIRPV